MSVCGRKNTDLGIITSLSLKVLNAVKTRDTSIGVVLPDGERFVKTIF
jgi:hypothetical protein